MMQINDLENKKGMKAVCVSILTLISLCLSGLLVRQNQTKSMKNVL